MLLIFPWVVYLAAVTSAVMLIVLWKCGEVGRRALVVLSGWFLLAAYCQFAGASAVVAAAGLGLQTLLAIYLVLRWRLTG